MEFILYKMDLKKLIDMILKAGMGRIIFVLSGALLVSVLAIWKIIDIFKYLL